LDFIFGDFFTDSSGRPDPNFISGYARKALWQPQTSCDPTTKMLTYVKFLTEIFFKSCSPNLQFFKLPMPKLQIGFMAQKLIDEKRLRLSQGPIL
jgi:hypothetical protein